MNNPTIEVSIAEILREIKDDQKEMLKKMLEVKDGISELKIEITEVRGDIKTLNTKVEQLDKRIANQEFTNRGVLVGLILALLVGVAKVFGFGGNI